VSPVNSDPSLPCHENLHSVLASLRGQVRIGSVVLAALLTAPIAVALGIASYFWLSSDADALRDSFLSSVDGGCKRRFVLNVGGLHDWLARFGLGFIKHLPPEAHMAASSVRGGEVAIYRLAEGIQALDQGRIIANADKAMNKRGMQRLVGVSADSDLVAVYMPRQLASPERVKALVLVVTSRRS